MTRSMEDVFDEFYERLSEPGTLEWNPSWDSAINREIFCDYPGRLTEGKGVPLFELEHLDESFSGFVNVKNSLVKNTIKKHGDIIYLEKGNIKYTQKIGEDCIETSFIDKENEAIINRSYDNLDNEKTLSYLLNFIRFDNPNEKSVSFSQCRGEAINLTLSNLGCPFPRIMLNLESDSNLVKGIIDNPSILRNVDSLIKFLGNKDCSVYLREAYENPQKYTLFQAVELLGISFFRV